MHEFSRDGKTQYYNNPMVNWEKSKGIKLNTCVAKKVIEARRRDE